MSFMEVLARDIYAGGAGLFVVFALLLLLRPKEQSTSDHTKLLKHIRLLAAVACFMLLGIGIKVFFL